MEILFYILLGIIILFIIIPQLLVFIVYMIVEVYYKKWKQTHKGEDEK